MIDRLPAWFFLSSALVLIGVAMLPIIRFLLGIDMVIGIQPLTVVMLLISGLMCGLSAMILLTRRRQKLTQYKIQDSDNDKKVIIQLHACGLLLFTGIPLANFLLAYWFWIRHRGKSELIDQQGEEVLNFQITIYLYLLLALFLSFVIIGLFFIPLLLFVHATLTLFAIYFGISKGRYTYPLNIPIIQGRSNNT